jgi:hypothetical protein
MKGRDLVDTLLKTAYEDTQLLQKNDSLGDNFAIPRDVDFVLLAPDEANAAVVRDFINDNRYGRARIETPPGQFRVIVVIHMPIEQNILCSVSALMICTAALFDSEYDGWGCVITNSSNQPLQPTAGRSDV